MTKSEIKQTMRNIIKKADKEIRMLTDEEKNRMTELEAELAKLKEKENSDEESVEDVPNEPEDNREDVIDDNDDMVEEPEDKMEDKMEETMEKKASKPEETPKEDDKVNSNCRKRNMKSNVRKNTNREMEFRLMKAIRDIANNRSLDEAANAVVSEARRSMSQGGLSYGGQIQIPVNETRAFTVADDGDVVATDVYTIMKPLRAKNVMLNAGAKFLTNLVGDVQVPILGASNVTWEGEVAPAKDGKGAITSKKLSPKRLTAYIDLSKQFITQDSADAEAAIREDIVNAINSKLEATILGEADGSTTQPEGIFKTVEPNSTPVSTFAGLTSLEAQVETANVLGECKYIVSPKAKAVLRAMPKSAKNTQLVMEGGEIDGVPTFVTSNITDSKVVYGDWSNLAIGQFGGAADIIVDPYSKATEGQVRLVINAYFDAVVLRPEAFATAKIANA